MTIIRQLDSGARKALTAHFLALSTADRRLRFGTPVGAAAVGRYVDGIDFERDAVFGVHEEELIGVAHLALRGRDAELGLSVLGAHRGRGIGSALFGRAATRARNRSMSALVMRALHGNAPIIRLARRFGMEIIRVGDETEARLELPPVSLASLAAEFLSDTLARRDDAADASRERRPSARAQPATATRALLPARDGTH
jgi:GNAT superfamily N-acetyltransferase